jgi:stage II sporulation protein AA (anti-sigma F factor antagonist)
MTVTAEFDGGALRLALEGELDHHAAKRAVAALEEGIDTHLPRVCVMDLRGLTFMDSSGIAVLLKARRRMDELAGELRVEGVRKQPMRVLDAAGLPRLVKITEMAKEG